MPSPSRGLTRIAINAALLERIDEIKPPYMDLTTFINFTLDNSLTGVSRIKTQSKTYPASGDPTRSQDPQLNLSVSLPGKEGANRGEHRTPVDGGERDLSLRAEEAHVEPEALKKVSRTPAVVRDIPPNLTCHKDLIEAYWKAKPLNKSKAAWKLLVNELSRMQERYGDSVVRDQLKLAEACRWKGITVRKYEQYGMDKPKTSPQASGLDYEAMNNVVTPW